MPGRDPMTNPMNTARVKAKRFLEDEKQFHLGCLPTEQSHPLTRDLSDVLRIRTAAGIEKLQAVDRDIIAPARELFRGGPFAQMRDAMLNALHGGGKIVFSGCGATGRLSLLLESAWREFWQALGHTRTGKRRFPAKMENSVCSLMTGGDYALVRSVENFEDYPQFGRRQAQEMRIRKGDVLIAISEGGETSSVLGSLHEGVARGAAVFFLFNNPAGMLCRHIARARAAIENKHVTAIPLYSGPMAVAGSTRMQAATFEMLAAGAALELALDGIVGREFPGHGPVAQSAPEKYADCFAALLDDLAARQAVARLAALTELEAETYGNKARATYYAGACLLDIFTDTTERAPTFMLPPFRKCDDRVSPPSWAFVKHPFLPTPQAWEFALRRPPRCLAWTAGDYAAMKAPAYRDAAPPNLRKEELFKFLIGCEEDPSRYEKTGSVAMLVCAGKENENIRKNRKHPLAAHFAQAMSPYSQTAVLSIGGEEGPVIPGALHFHLAAGAPVSGLRLWDRLAAKLVFNTVSTATMGRLGRLSGNWMTHVEASNKKLIDRSTRLIAEISGLSYEEACLKLHETLEGTGPLPAGAERISPVQKTLAALAAARAASAPSGAMQ